MFTCAHQRMEEKEEEDSLKGSLNSTEVEGEEGGSQGLSVLPETEGERRREESQWVI